LPHKGELRNVVRLLIDGLRRQAAARGAAQP
jgi:hypothetical protein